jgi:hypothetical protein
VTVVMEGLDDPKGMVFIDGSLVTADFDKVWAVDATGRKRCSRDQPRFPRLPCS